MAKTNTKDSSPAKFAELLDILKVRFAKNPNRHKGIEWTNVLAKLEANTQKLHSQNQMELTGGEPDVVGYDAKTNEFIFYDCSTESPKGRRSLCYDNVALEARKQHKPKNIRACLHLLVRGIFRDRSQACEGLDVRQIQPLYRS